MKQIKSIKHLGENEVIHCPTEAEAIAICQLMHDAGLKWCTGTSFIENNQWECQKDEMVYYPKQGEFGSIVFALKNKRMVYPASSFLPESFYQVEPKGRDMICPVPHILGCDVNQPSGPMSEAHSSVIIDPMKFENIEPRSQRLRNLYDKVDPATKKLMQQEFPDMFEKVKNYVKLSDAPNYLSPLRYHDADQIAYYVFENCTPEIVGNEIRFIKN